MGKPGSPNATPGTARTGIKATSRRLTTCPRHGPDSLQDAGIAVAGTAQRGLGFVCRLENRPSSTENIPRTSNPHRHLLRIADLRRRPLRALSGGRGLTWLASKQQAIGGLSVGDGAATVAPNTNTTGLAGQAFRAGGRLLAAHQAKTFILSNQAGCAAPLENRGAIAYDATGYDPNTPPYAPPHRPGAPAWRS